jgi:hypothetical protein
MKKNHSQTIYSTKFQLIIDKPIRKVNVNSYPIWVTNPTHGQILVSLVRKNSRKVLLVLMPQKSRRIMIKRIGAWDQ